MSIQALVYFQVPNPIHMKNLQLALSLLLIPFLSMGQAITDDGTNVGIANPSPDHRLDVNGDINLSTGNIIRIGDRPIVSTVGTANAFIGDFTGASITTGYNNAFIGYKAGEDNTQGHSNAFIGFKAGENNTSGFSNAFIGQQAGRANLTGKTNVMIGRRSGFNSFSGDDNVFIGHLTGQTNTTGSSNTYIGSGADGSAGLTNSTAIGANASVNQDSSIVLGDNAKVGIGTSTPSYDLDVAGDVNFTGGLYENGVLFSGGATGPTGPSGADGATGPTGPVVSGSNGQSLRHDGSDWVASSFLYNNGFVVGVGTTNPQQTLDVNGAMRVSGPASSNKRLEIVRHEDATNYHKIEATSNGLEIDSYLNAPIILESGTGGVGIGTTSPNAELDVDGTVSLSGELKVGATSQGKLSGSGLNLIVEAAANLKLHTGSGPGYDVSIHKAGAGTAFATFEGTYENLLLGTATEDANSKLKVVHDGWHAGDFSSSSSSNNVKVIRARYTGSGLLARGVDSECVAADGYGYGVFSVGGYIGTYGQANGGSAAGWAHGLYGHATGTDGTRVGVYGTSTSTGLTNYGVYGNASGADTDWAGYFNNGDVYVDNFLGIGDLTPDYPISVSSNSHTSVHIEQSVASSGINYGIKVDLDNTHNGNSSSYGSRIAAINDNGSGITYGSLFQAGGTSTGVKYGVYGHAYGSGTLYAGYFSGDVYATGSYLPSDKKLKTNIEEVDDAVKILSELKVHSYRYKTDEFNQMNLQEGMRYGFIAEELKEVLPQFVKTTYQPLDILEDPENGNQLLEFEAVNYTELIPLLTRAMQQQQEMIGQLQPDRIDALEAELAEKDQEIQGLKEMMNQILQNQEIFDADLQQCCFKHEDAGSSTVTLSGPSTSLRDLATLEQNQPNPFQENTVIKYYLPQTSEKAQLQIADMNGIVLKTFNLQGTGFGQVLISGGSLKAGTYLYTLSISGEKTLTKRMILL